MLIPLHPLSTVALPVWDTRVMRIGIIRVYGARLRTVLDSNVEKRPSAFYAGLGVTALMQSSSTTTIPMTLFVAQDLVGLTPALVIVLGADVETVLVARILTFDLSWLSPLLIFIEVIFFLSHEQTHVGQLGQVGTGLGLILLALELIVQAVNPVTQTNGVQMIFVSLTGNIMLDVLVGAVFAIISYPSLAAALLMATLATAGAISFPVVLCLVVGANLGLGLLVMLSNNATNAAVRRAALGSLLFRLVGNLIILPFVHPLAAAIHKLPLAESRLVTYFHALYNLLCCIAMISFAGPMARLYQRMIHDEPELDNQLKPKHLSPSVLNTSALTLTSTTRKTLRIRDTMEQMSGSLHKVTCGEPCQEKESHRMTDDINVFYTVIKFYLV